MKYFLVVMLMLGVLPVFGQHPTTVSGTVHSERFRQVSLFKVVDGVQKRCATANVGKDKSYRISFVPEKEGFYTLGFPKIDFKIYVKGGEEINIDLYDDKALLNGENTRENISLYRWENYAWDICTRSVRFFKRSGKKIIPSTYKDFFPDFEKFIDGLPELRKSLGSGNPEFDIRLQKMIAYETDYYAVHFLETPRMEHPDKADWPEYYHNIQVKGRFSTQDILNFPNGLEMMNSLVSFAVRNDKEKGKKDYIDLCMSYIDNDVLKGECLLKRCFTRLKTYDQYQDLMEKYGRYLTPCQKSKAEAAGKKVHAFRSGIPAKDFSYPDAKGKMHSLSDFKGKVVLVDVWATWCAPCRAEIPHLVRLEKEMEAKGLVVIGVSVDRTGSRQKWMNFVKAHDLGGVQLFSAGGGKIKRDYNITGIPRFMVFGKDGKVVSVYAPRPSDPSLKAMLEKELKK